MIALCPNPYRDNDLELTRRAIDMLSKEGFECAVCPVFAEPGDEVLPGDISYKSLRDIVKDCSLIIPVGGDGTLLAVARDIRGISVPLLGVNLGTKGFMASIEQDELPLLIKAAEGKFKPSSRMMLDVSVIRHGEIICRDCVLNDVVMHGFGDCIKLTAWCDGDLVTSFSGDGLIVSTPTGSTGYSMSAGGPIVEPTAMSILISPICAHTMSARPYVLSSHRTIKVKMEKMHGRRAYLAADGNSVLDLANEDEIIVNLSQNTTVLADMELKNFYQTTFDKLK